MSPTQVAEPSGPTAVRSDKALTGEQGRQVAFDALRTAITSGELVPAQHLVEIELAQAYGVTRGALRAALLDLAAEGLIDRVPNKGSRVRVVTVEEAIAITEVRMQLEGLCAAKAAERASAEDRATLRRIGKEMRAAVAAADSIRYSQLNIELHSTIRDVGHQPVAVELLDKLNGQLVRHRFRLSQRDGRPRQSLGEHLEIIQGIVTGDGPRATAAVHAHLHSVIDALRATPAGQL